MTGTPRARGELHIIVGVLCTLAERRLDFEDPFLHDTKAHAIPQRTQHQVPVFSSTLWTNR